MVLASSCVFLRAVYVSWGINLPNPTGPLSSTIPSPAIEEANAAVRATAEEQGVNKRKRGPYLTLSDNIRAQIGKYAGEHGVSAAARHFTKVIGKPISVSTVYDCKKAYCKELSRKRKADEDLTIERLPTKKRGCPLLVGEELDRRVQHYLTAIRDSGGAVNTAITLAAAKGIILKTNRTLLAEYGGHVVLTKDWAKSLLKRMKYVKRRATTSKSRSVIEDFDAVKEEFLQQVVAVVTMEEIPPELIMNWDQTGLNIIPSSSWTMDQRGSRRVELTGLKDKRMITAVFCGTLSGDFLPIQLVYK